MSATSATPNRASTGSGLNERLQPLYRRFLHVENTIHHQLVKHSITGLRIALGLVFLGFGALKYFPGVSPAQTVTEATTHILFLGLIPGAVAMKMIATLECLIGICLLTNRWMRLAIWLLGIEFIGILAPIFVLPGRLFAGPHHAPTLLGQYCLKDIILVTGALVVAAGSFRGGRMIRDDLPPNIHVPTSGVIDADHKLRIVLDGLNRPDELRAVCERQNITESEFHEWRLAVLFGAKQALTVPVTTNGHDSDRAPRVAALPPARAASESSAHPMLDRFLTLLTIAVVRRH
jgi:putative oxidoreductase